MSSITVTHPWGLPVVDFAADQGWSAVQEILDIEEMFDVEIPESVLV